MKFRFIDDCFLKLFFIAVACKVCMSDGSDSHFYPSENDEDYHFPKYPIQQYIQVRKTVSVEHVPYGGASEDTGKSDTLQKSASQDVSSSSGGSATNQHPQAEGNHEHYYKPPLREEIFVKKKQEVYEERGYHDGQYDHSGSGGYYRDGHNDNYNQHQQPYEASASSANSHYNKRNRQSKKYGGNYRHHVPKKPVGSEEGSSTKVLEHIANNLSDNDAQAVGFYRARSHIYCPEVIDFDLSSKSQKMGEGLRPKGKRRLNGLGTKIDCLKRKYFGNEPKLLPSSVFMDPAESRRSVIKMESMNQFWDNIKKQIH